MYTLCVYRRLTVITKIQKWGNSLGLRIPKSFAKEAHVEAGGRVDLSMKEGNLLIRPVRARRYRLAALLAGITRENLHDEVRTGKAKGREIW
jgi:antitoxin MazE